MKHKFYCIERNQSANQRERETQTLSAFQRMHLSAPAAPSYEQLLMVVRSFIRFGEMKLQPIRFLSPAAATVNVNDTTGQIVCSALTSPKVINNELSTI